MLIKSALVTQISGSIGGMTGSHNRGGMYLRSRAVPTDPATAAQVAVRNHMADLTSRWTNTLTPLQRTAWDTYAFNVPLINPLGDPINVSGLAMYVRSNVPRLQAGVLRVDVAPVIFNLGDFTAPSFAFSAASNQVNVTFDNTDDWANEDEAFMFVRNSRQASISINFFKGPYRFTDKIDGDGTTPPTSPATLTSPFNLDATNKAFAVARVSRADGRLSSPFRGSGVIAA